MKFQGFTLEKAARATSCLLGPLQTNGIGLTSHETAPDLPVSLTCSFLTLYLEGLSLLFRMDDLSGLNWSSSTSQDASKKPVMNSGSLFSNIRPSPPISGRSTPLSIRPSSALAPSSNPPSKPATPANDSFSNLVSFGAASSNKNLSLAEQQKRLQEQKTQQEATRRKLAASQYEVKDSTFWENLGSGKSTPARVQSPPTIQAPSAVRTFESTTLADPEEDDLLAAFNSSAPVDASSNFPIPKSSKPTSPEPSSQVRAAINPISSRKEGGLGLDSLMSDDDDPFGLGQMNKTDRPNTQVQATDDDDDFLGLLGKPITELPPLPIARNESSRPREVDEGASAEMEPYDRAIAELVDMGFPAEKAQQALAATESGVDIQAAVGWLLNQAHTESKQKSRSRDVSGRPPGSEESERRAPKKPERPPKRPSQDGAPTPAWMRAESASTSGPRRNDSRSPANGERDPTRVAGDIGNNIYSFWKAGTKKMQQAVQEFNSDSDSSQPRWMRDPNAAEPRAPKSRVAQDETGPRRRRSSASKQETNDTGKQPEVTDEALMLEGDRRPPPRKSVPARQDLRFMPDTDSSRDTSPAVSNRLPQRSAPPPTSLRKDVPPKMDPKARLSRQAVEEQSAEAYVSPARRRKAAPKPPIAKSEPDLLFNTSSAPRADSGPNTRPAITSPMPQPQRPPRPSAPQAVRPKPPQRHIPPVSPSALSQSHTHRQRGTEAYKRGDYTTAHASYSSALSSLPEKHPIAIIILSNRAMTGLKVGEPKTAVADADLAIALIGPSRGEAETISLENSEAPKDMKEFYGKALIRKAEALEQMERWEEAAKVWREAVELGHGGSTSIAGRNRCEKAAGINQPVKAAQAPRRPPPKNVAPPKKQSALDDLSGRPAMSNAPSAEAVTRLREANAAADRADDEKFALADHVDAKLTAWKGGKQDNLRALLGSLDTVLWPEAGWKKVGMSELVLPNKVKIVYMKGIAKVHPDKVRSKSFSPFAIC